MSVCLHVCNTCTITGLLSSRRGQKKASDLELELRTIVGWHVGSRNKTQTLSKSSK